jgi:hypothetical protein
LTGTAFSPMTYELYVFKLLNYINYNIIGIYIKLVKY